MRKVILLFILITSVLGAWADGNVTFTASAPDVVVSGDQFRLTYTVNTHKVRDFRAPNIKGFDVLMGPSRSQQSSTQIINGNVTSTSSITFTYILMADKEGTYTIPGATIVADGQNKTSNSVQIKVLPPDQTNGVGGGNNSGGRTSSRSQVAGSKITNQDLFITATASKTTVYEQEAILLTYKVYTLVNLRQLRGDMPKLTNIYGQNKTSNSVQIKVLPPDQTNGVGGGNNSGGRTSSRSQVAGSKITNQDLFITATASKTTVYEQEAILLTYKVYTLVNLRQLRGDMPKLTNIYVQEVELPQQKTFSLEHYNGRNYNTTVWSQYVLFPQQSGKIEIPAITFEGVIAQQVASDDPFDAFFNGGSNYVEVKKNIVTPKLTINVKALPDGKPANFSGGVGEFTISSSISTKELKTNDAVTIKLVISGTGNLKLVNTPEVAFPKDFEVYDPKIDNKFTLTREGLSGNKVIEYLAIPRHAGNFTIPPVEFSYFDLKSNSYKTIKTEAYNLKVEKGAGNADQVIADFTNKEDLKVLGQDIRYIKMGETSLTRKGDFFFGSTTYYLWYIIPLVLFVVFVIVYRKKAIENANVAKVRTKKANKVAAKRMKNAGRLLAENKQEAFYDEVLKALWGYISDKLNIPVSQLSKDNIEDELTKYGVAPELIKDFIGTLNECEFARYAPGNQNEAMDKVYSSAVEVISKMENSIKH